MPLTLELKEKIKKLHFFKLNEEEENSDHSNIGTIVAALDRFKFVYGRTKWLELRKVIPEFQDSITKKLVSIHQIMGDALFDIFLFEYL